MSNKVNPALASLFNRILVNYNKPQEQPQVVEQPVIVEQKPSMLAFRGGGIGKKKRRVQAQRAAQMMIEKQMQKRERNFQAAPVVRDAMAIEQPFVLNQADLAPARRGPRNGKTTWHPLSRVKEAISDFLPVTYWSKYRLNYNFGPGRPSGSTIATKIKWRKLLGDVFAINKMGRLRYTKGQFKTYDNRKRWKQAVGRRAQGWRY